ncbi:hypothetical protein HZH66_003394 [Vespula vulgaris]|uniref:RIM zinc finger domain-containing protein n=1 Tax=Vespula vulgaris TaxID=7454 RepID=A0A834NGV5_VESVU|nr:hypothetical protein HZH66_003394 [Vespula vulgaris]
MLPEVLSQYVQRVIGNRSKGKILPVLVRQYLNVRMHLYVRRRKQDEVQVLEETIRARSEKHKKAGVELNATCQVCMKTKFADGIGHNCNYCHIRCCARCGGKVTLRSRRVSFRLDKD